MPLYEFICPECGVHFSEFAKVADRNKVEHCGMLAEKIISIPTGILMDNNLKDSKGCPISFPKVGGYYDKALDKTFESKKQKHAYMKEHKFIQDGSSDNKSTRKRPEAGDTREVAPVYSTPK